MATIKAHTLSGFMELLPAPQTQMERLMEVLRSSYGVYGFTPLDTPIIEASDVLLAKGGGETEKQIYRFSKGDSDLSLRFDLTVPLAKYVALHYADLAFPFRRFQIGKVYRGERAQRGRFREFYQADIDVIGDGELDITNDAEIPAIIYTVFSRLGLSRFQIRINNRRILNGFYAMLGLSDKSGDIMRTVDKIEKIGPDLVRAILVDDYAIEGEKADEILAFIGIGGQVAYVGDVHDPVHIVAHIAQVLLQHILHDVAAEVADVGKVIHRGAAGIHFHMARCVGGEFGFLMGGGVVKIHNIHPFRVFV